MRLFDESSSHSDDVRGRITTGGYAKGSWLDWPKITFVCKPLQAFFTSFRSFHREHHYHIIRLSYGEGWDKPLREYEAEIQKDIYALASHFDTVLDDPDADWTSRRTIEAPPEVRLPSIEPPAPETHHSVEEENPNPSPSYSAPVPATSGTGGGKRKREESQVPDEPQAKHIALSEDEDEDTRVSEAAQPTPRAPRRRRPPPPPSDRVLRPRPWRK